MTLLEDHCAAMRRPKSWRRIIRMALQIIAYDFRKDMEAWIAVFVGLLIFGAAILTISAFAAPQTVIIEEIFSPDMFWTEDGEMVVLEGVRYAADNLEGDEDRYVCEILADEFEGRVASLRVESVVHGPDHDYLNARVKVGRKDMNRRAEEIISEVIGERGDDEGWE